MFLNILLLKQAPLKQAKIRNIYKSPVGVIFLGFFGSFFLAFDYDLFTNFANAKSDHADHSLKPDNADMTC